MSTNDSAKILAAQKSLEFIQDGMVVGLGSGTTATHFIRLLGEKVKQGLKIRGIASSKASEDLAASLTIPIVDFNTSISRNFNERGYGTYTVDSPATDADYTPNAAAPDWDFRVVYEAWIDVDAFGASGFGDACDTVPT